MPKINVRNVLKITFASHNHFCVFLGDAAGDVDERRRRKMRHQNMPYALTEEKLLHASG